MKCQHAMLQELRFTTHTQTSIRHFIKQLKCIIKLYYNNNSMSFSNHPKWEKTPSHIHITCQRKTLPKGFHNTPSIPSQSTFPTHNSLLIFERYKQSQSTRNLYLSPNNMAYNIYITHIHKCYQNPNQENSQISTWVGVYLPCYGEISLTLPFTWFA